MRSVSYGSSPLLAHKTQLWRSRLVMMLVALGFLGLAGRAAYVQLIGNDFFLRQGEVRFARTIELAANRGRILDRNGLILASSVPAASIWAIPEDVDMADPAVLAQLPALAQLMDVPLAQLKQSWTRTKPLSGSSASSIGMWASKSRRWPSKASTKRANTSASTRRENRRPTLSALPMWRTKAKRAWSWPLKKSWLANRARAG